MRLRLRGLDWSTPATVSEPAVQIDTNALPLQSSRNQIDFDGADEYFSNNFFNFNEIFGDDSDGALNQDPSTRTCSYPDPQHTTNETSDTQAPEESFESVNEASLQTTQSTVPKQLSVLNETLSEHQIHTSEQNVAFARPGDPLQTDSQNQRTNPEEIGCADNLDLKQDSTNSTTSILTTHNQPFFTDSTVQQDARINVSKRATQEHAMAFSNNHSNIQRIGDFYQNQEPSYQTQNVMPQSFLQSFRNSNYGQSFLNSVQAGLEADPSMLYLSPYFLSEEALRQLAPVPTGTIKASGGAPPSINPYNQYQDFHQIDTTNNAARCYENPGKLWKPQLASKADVANKPHKKQAVTNRTDSPNEVELRRPANSKAAVTVQTVRKRLDGVEVDYDSLLQTHPTIVQAWSKMYSKQALSSILQYYVQIAQVYGQDRVKTIMKAMESTHVDEFDHRAVFAGHGGVPFEGFEIAYPKTVDPNTPQPRFKKGQRDFELVHFRKSWEVLPIGTTCQDIVEKYPNHWEDENLDAFMQHHITAGSISKAIPDSLVDTLKNAGSIQGKQNADNIIQKRLLRRRAVGIAKYGEATYLNFINSDIHIRAAGDSLTVGGSRLGNRNPQRKTRNTSSKNESAKRRCEESDAAGQGQVKKARLPSPDLALGSDATALPTYNSDQTSGTSWPENPTPQVDNPDQSHSSALGGSVISVPKSTTAAQHASMNQLQRGTKRCLATNDSQHDTTGIVEPHIGGGEQHCQKRQKVSRHSEPVVHEHQGRKIEVEPNKRGKNNGGSVVGVNDVPVICGSDTLENQEHASSGTGQDLQQILLLEDGTVAPYQAAMPSIPRSMQSDQMPSSGETLCDEEIFDMLANFVHPPHLTDCEDTQTL